jgi:DNA-binding NarL/FixJ family response regulator
MADRLRVVIAEDNYLVREGVRRLLEDSGQVEVVACVGDARELLDAVRRLTPSAVLTDIGCRPVTTWRASRPLALSVPSTPGSASWCCRSTQDESYARALFN